jgi:nitrogen fixation-related uncharacterized protein
MIAIVLLAVAASFLAALAVTAMRWGVDSREWTIGIH